MVNKSVVKILTEKGIKVTPQRIAILEIVLSFNNHPTIENINEYLRLNYPTISLSTIYRSLELFTSKGIVSKIQTEDNPVRFDGVTEEHHHLYSPENDRIEDYFDEALKKLVLDYLTHKEIPGFQAENINIRLIGKFSDSTD